MDQTAKLLDTLKAYLKSRDITYRNLAQRLKLSESSIKRVFSEKTLSLKRLERILHSLDLDFYDLAHMSRRQDGDSKEALSPEQEESLLENPRMLIFLHLLIQKWKVEEIADSFDFESDEITRILLELDRLRLIDLHPHNQYKVLLNNTQLWNRRGPFMKKFKEMLQNGFLAHDFEETHERFLFSPSQLSEESRRILLKEIDRLLRRFKELSEADAGPEKSGLEPSGLMVSFRPWKLPLLENYRRKKGSPDSLVGHDRISAIDVDHLTGDCGRSIAAEKSRRFADFLLSCCSFHRRMLTCNPQHFRKIFNPGCRKRPDGSWRNDIGADIFWTQFPGQVSY